MRGRRAAGTVGRMSDQQQIENAAASHLERMQNAVRDIAAAAERLTVQREALAQAERDHERAFKDALDAGWDEAGLRAIGVDNPSKRGPGRPRKRGGGTRRKAAGTPSASAGQQPGGAGGGEHARDENHGTQMGTPDSP